MPRLKSLVRLLALAGCGVAFMCATARAIDDAKLPVKKILFFTKCSNFEHSVVKAKPGEPGFAGRVLIDLGKKHALQFTVSKDGSLFTPEYLAQFDAYMFYTSGDLLSPGKDGNPPMTPAGKQALLDAVRGGKAFIGTHSAADTFHTDETAETDTNRPRTWRYRVLAQDKEDPYTKMLGGELIVHGTQQVGRIIVADPKFPGFGSNGGSFELQEEWYSMTNFTPDMHVILVQDTTQMHDAHADGKNWPPTGWDTPYKRPPYPETWVRMEGKGRVFYTSMAHREDTWQSAQFQEMLLGGIDWALGRVDADITPNLDKVAPGAKQLPPVSGPVAGLPKGVK